MICLISDKTPPHFRGKCWWGFVFYMAPPCGAGLSALTPYGRTAPIPGAAPQRQPNVKIVLFYDLFYYTP